LSSIEFSDSLGPLPDALRTVRRASVGDALISVRSAEGGFVVTVESVETPVAVTTEVYPTMDEAIARGIEEIGLRQEHPV
jgi:hypothetical protein